MTELMREVLEVVQTVTVVDILEHGAQGPPGAAGGASFTFVQPTPATEWIINHNLGYRPVVEVFDTGGSQVNAYVLHVSNNQTRIYFSPAAAGSARLI